MEKSEILKKIMSHAVRGHTKGGEEWHTFCNDPAHAEKILVENNVVLRPTFGDGTQEAVSDAESEGMPAHG